jgi:hypothetical protein
MPEPAPEPAVWEGADCPSRPKRAEWESVCWEVMAVYVYLELAGLKRGLEIVGCRRCSEVFL